MLPLSLYIHFPWCLRKCPYCDFNSYPSPQSAIPEAAYFTALLADLEQDLPQIANRPLQSIFFGGGTPSLLSPATIEQLLTAIHHKLTLSPSIEITLEANPGTLDNSRCQALRHAGINRLSLGIQSFDDTALLQLGRIHNRQQAITAINLAKPAGFHNFNLDLMFGLPGQTVTAALTDLTTAVALAPPHLSWYQLTIEPHTAFYQQPPSLLPDEDTLWEIQTQGQAYLADHHYPQYEISAYAQPSHRCQHNLNYWNFGDYLGIGAGAHSKLTAFNHQTISRFSKQSLPDRYLALAHTPQVIEHKTLLTKADLSLEFMMNTLRLTDGFTLSQFTTHTGLTVADIAAPLQQAYLQGWLTRQGDNIRPTPLGMQFLNRLLQLFM